MEGYPPLVQPSDLSDFPGAPFSVGAVEGAADAIRRVAGWHIAPVVQETLTLDSDGSRLLVLPTGKLNGVEQVRDMTGSSPRVIEGWTVSHRLGVLELRRGWPCGFGAIEVDLSHGYFECPADLLPVIADRTQRRVRQQAAGPFSTTYESSTEDRRDPMEATVASYKLAPRP